MTAPQTATLTDFLLACIAEDEERAEAAREVGSRWAQLADHVAADHYGAGWHVLTQSPAHVLAVSAAHRRIVELHRDGRSGDYIEPWCATCSDDEDLVYLPCPTLRALASAYADHEDWREEWR